MRRLAAALLAALAVFEAGGCASEAPAPAASAPSVEMHVLRLRPGQDLRAEILRFARERGLRAAVVVSCAGSLTRAAVRFADHPTATLLEGKREIVSLSGTVTAEGAHLHIAVSDGEGVTLGGHLMDGSLVYTTAEVALLEGNALRFAREKDPAYGYEELVVKPR